MPTWNAVTVAFTGNPEAIDDIEEAAICGNILDALLPTPEPLTTIGKKPNPYYIKWLESQYGTADLRAWREKHWGTPFGDVDAHVLHRDETYLVVRCYVAKNRAVRGWRAIAKKFGLAVTVNPALSA